MELTIKTYIVSAEDEGMRLDVFLAKYNPDLTRSYFKRIIDGSQVKLNGENPKAGEKVRMGDQIELVVSPPEPLHASPEPIPLDIIYEDSEIIVINKPAGLVVHPAAGHYSGTLVNGLLYHCQNLSSLGDPLRPGIVHRLDKNTSGAMVVAKTDAAHQHLAAQFKAHSITKVYRAVVVGVMDQDAGTVSSLIGRHPKDPKKMSVRINNGKLAITHWEVLKRYPNLSLLNLRLETGRTHQIRVHLASIHHPVLGDPEYGGRKIIASLPDAELRGLISAVKRQFLHAYVLGFVHPAKEEYMEFTAPFPEEFQKLLRKLEEQK
ncbi:MAG: RluA family pseudouridine synthase, partial [Desulfobacterota bacterium]|nr:RluA family pseudouridine synthase [Thermodesulfobacteriota bacterium]